MASSIDHPAQSIPAGETMDGHRSSLEPNPVDLPSPTVAGRAARVGRLSLLAARHLPTAAGSVMTRRRTGASPRALRRMFEGMGSTYVKFGQFIASAPGIVGEVMAEEFRTCLDTGPAVPFAIVRRTIEADLGRPLETVFAEFEQRALAAASIAVVHRARLRDGRKVAVKVLRPGIERIVATDLALMERLIRMMAAQGVDQMYNLVALLVGLRAQIAEELDLRNEARAMEVFRGLFEDFELRLLTVPTPYPEYSGRRVLTMELLDGRPIDDWRLAQERGVDPRPLLRELLKAWVLTGLRAGAFHADIHAGNLLLLRDGRLGMIDWGIVARMEAESQRMFRALCEASIGREEAWEDMGQVMREINGPSWGSLGLTDEQVTRFCRATFEPVLTRPLSEVSMSELLPTRDDVLRKATGAAPPRRGFRDTWRSMRSAARTYRLSAANGAFEHPTFRMGFLSMKQLIYLERYGRMYLPDESLLGDGEFIRRALEEPSVEGFAGT